MNDETAPAKTEWTLEDSRFGYDATLRLTEHLAKRVNFLEDRLNDIERPGGRLDLIKCKDTPA